MAKTKNLTKEKGSDVWMFRMRVPKDLRPILGKWEWMVSLRACASEGDAVDKAHALTQAHTAQVLRLRGMIQAGDAAGLVQDATERAKIDIAAAVSLIMANDTSDDRRRQTARDLSAVVSAVLPHLTDAMRKAITEAGGPLPFVGEAFAFRRALDAPAPGAPTALEFADMTPDQIKDRSLSHVLDVEGFNLAREAVTLDAPILKSLGLLPETPAPSPLALSVISEAWLKDTELLRSATTAEKHRNRVREFIKQHGDVALDDPSAADAMREYVRTRGKTQVVTTAQKDAGTLQQVCAWAVERGRSKDNPAAGLKKVLPKDDRRQRDLRHSFRPAQIHQIVTKAAETWGANSDRYACLMLMIATGCRIGEAIKLRPQDVREDAACGGGWVVDFNEERATDGAERSLKNTPSIRVIPLHSAVTDVVVTAKARNASAPVLFNMPGTGAVRAFSMAITRLIEVKCGIADPGNKLSAHSLRHTIADLGKARDPDGRPFMAEKELNDYLGHVDADPYGMPTDCNVMRRLIERLDVLAMRHDAATSTQPDTSTTTAD